MRVLEPLTWLLGKTRTVKQPKAEKGKQVMPPPQPMAMQQRI
jgi:hypothetical protein